MQYVLHLICDMPAQPAHRAHRCTDDGRSHWICCITLPHRYARPFSSADNTFHSIIVAHLPRKIHTLHNIFLPRNCHSGRNCTTFNVPAKKVFRHDELSCRKTVRFRYLRRTGGNSPSVPPPLPSRQERQPRPRAPRGRSTWRSSPCAPPSDRGW